MNADLMPKQLLLLQGATGLIEGPQKLIRRAYKQQFLGTIPTLDFAIEHRDSESMTLPHSARNFLPLTESHSAQPKIPNAFSR